MTQCAICANKNLNEDAFKRYERHLLLVSEECPLTFLDYLRSKFTRPQLIEQRRELRRSIKRRVHPGAARKLSLVSRALQEMA